jgi:hypothetical protein
MQINDTLILGDSKFKALKHKELAKANIITKLIVGPPVTRGTARNIVICLLRW